MTKAKPQRRIGGPAWQPGEPTLVVSEIAERLRPIASDVAGTVQRIRHWTRERLLLPVADQHSGTGKHRRYAMDTAFVAAVLHTLTSAGFTAASIAASRQLVDSLTMCRFAAQGWRTGSKKSLYLTILKAGTLTKVGVEPKYPTQMAIVEEKRNIDVSAELMIVVDLAKLWTQVA